MRCHEVQITSAQNPRIKHLLKLRDRRYRDQHGSTLIEGYRELRQAINNHYYPKNIFYCPSLFLGTNEGVLLENARENGAVLFETSEKIFSKISYRDRPDGLIGVGPKLGVTLAEIQIKSEFPLVLVAESVEKPGNLGAMLRSADAAGLDAVIVCDKKTEINNPNVVRASVGTLFTIPVAEASTDETISFLSHNNFNIVLASPNAVKSYWELDYCKPMAVVVGSEQYGLSEKWKGIGVPVKIPMLGKADSLNVSSAATLILYEALRQRNNFS